MRRLLIALLVGAGLGAVVPPGPVLSQSTSPQLARGKTIYAARCAHCHGPKGEGGKGPRLVGSEHNLTGYETAEGLYAYTRQVMPADRPGRLLEPEYWAVLAYILSENGLLPSGIALGRGNAAQVPLYH
jgi:S-disulfanyl-L-cysteine oxidoreductase SoxD